MYQNLRPFRDTLLSRGYDYHWSELPEGHSWGLWRANIDFLLEYFFPSSGTSVEQSSFVNEKSFEVFQNYPNPFNPSTRIRFSIPNNINENQLVTITLYDILGRELSTLLNEEKAPGYYEYLFNAESLSLTSGVYLYKLQAGEFISIKKMILTK
ncbi:MAG: T9SS type A sorting domain-containing protein [Ignavibacteriaceae bacterium]|nr:T9SS type A sorting domain-containing protein [Ignavibacteriaceae bacterium]